MPVGGDVGAGPVRVVETRRVPSRQGAGNLARVALFQGSTKAIVPGAQQTTDLGAQFARRHRTQLSRTRCQEKVQPHVVPFVQRQPAFQHEYISQTRSQAVVHLSLQFVREAAFGKRHHHERASRNRVRVEDHRNVVASFHGLQRLDGFAQLLRRQGKQLHARHAVEQTHDFLVRVRAFLRALEFENLHQFHAQQGHRHRLLCVCPGSEQTQEPALAHYHTGGIDLFHTDVVHVPPAMDWALGVGFGNQPQGRLVEPAAQTFRKRLRLEVLRAFLRAQDAEAGPASHLRNALATVAVKCILAIPEEHEVFLPKPIEEGSKLIDTGRPRTRQRTRA
jgi:hypothetical protein